ncbi:MAG: Coenzyme F420:L-glutamate ligase [Candidatus Anoxychlamydiales bacterium]|nr:Coenzyme F420:L-glutamate ligase [Candidatus Anoxychlamydiales bacterium]
MNTMDAILNRRSIRKFNDKKVDKKIIFEILNAAMNAPSAYDQQPWHFIVIDDRKTLDEIPKFHPYAKMLNSCPQAILVLADLKLVQSKNMEILDCAAATQNILLACTEKDLGSVWVSVYFREDRVKSFKKLLKLPDNIIPISLIPFGYSDEVKKTKDNFKKERIHFNSF